MSNQKIKSALDAAGTAADYSARATYQRGYDAGVESSARATYYLGNYDAGYDAGVASLASERDAAIARAEKAEEDLRCFLRRRRLAAGGRDAGDVRQAAERPPRRARRVPEIAVRRV